MDTDIRARSLKSLTLSLLAVLIGVSALSYAFKGVINIDAEAQEVGTIAHLTDNTSGSDQHALPETSE